VFVADLGILKNSRSGDYWVGIPSYTIYPLNLALCENCTSSIQSNL